MRSIFYRIWFNTFIQILGKGISVLLGFITVGLLTRYLGKEGYGNFNLAFAYLSIFGIIADFGLQLTMVRELAKKDNLPKQIYGTYFWLKVLLVIFSTLLAIFCLLFFPYSRLLKIGIVIASLGVAVGVLNTYGSVIFQAHLRLDLLTYVDVFVRLITTVFVIFFIFLKFGLYSIFIAILFGNLAGTILISLLLRKSIIFGLDFNINLAKKLIISSLPVGFISILTLLYFKIDTLILSVIKGAEEVGIYSLAYKIIENLLVLWGFYIASVYPLFSNLINKRKKITAWVLWKKSLWLALGSSWLMIIFGFIFAPTAIKILGGEGFRESVFILRVLLFSLPFFFINNLFYHFFLAREKIKMPLLAYASSLVVNLTLNLILIPRWGCTAAALNTVITEIYLTAIYFICLFSSRHKLVGEYGTD